MSFVDFLEQHLVACSFKEATGLDCLGCGMQRSIVCILRGDFYGSIRYYPPLLFFIIYILSISLHLASLVHIPTDRIRHMTYALLVIVILSYILKSLFLF
jgi:hypothetical protein